MRRGLLLVCALTSCAANTTREEWLTNPAARSEGLCWWRNARWEDRATLLVRGTGEPFARARERWAGDTWRGASTTAVLRRAGPLVVLQGEWTGPGLTLNADVDVSAQAVFRAYQPLRLGQAGLLSKGAHVRVHDALTGRALVVPEEDALRPFRPDDSVALDLGCDLLSLSVTVEPPGDPARGLLALAGFSATAPERWVPENFSLPASAQFGGATIGSFKADERPLRGFVVEERGDEARLVVPTASGVLWVGWVAAEGLQVPQGPAPQPVPPKDPPSPLSGATDWRACNDTELQVSIESHGRVIEVGQLKPGVAFSVLSRRGDYREVNLGVEWLDLEPDVRLLLPASVNDCPRQKQLGAW
ncbi:MAG: hypothetical protein Q8L48_24575 [Archangium sp.]|nr:hypothetical protein [Archangium sp.]